MPNAHDNITLRVFHQAAAPIIPPPIMDLDAGLQVQAPSHIETTGGRTVDYNFLYRSGEPAATAFGVEWTNLTASPPARAYLGGDFRPGSPRQDDADDWNPLTMTVEAPSPGVTTDFRGDVTIYQE